MHHELREVTSFDEELQTLVRDMVATMYAANGVGLAANQVGVDLKVFVFDCPDDDDVRVTGVVVNPRLTLPEAAEFHGTGLLARCLQHETDHLHGTVFGDRVPAKARKKLYKKHEELADAYPGDWPVTPAAIED